MPTRPYSATVTAGDDILATQYNNLRLDALYHFSMVSPAGALPLGAIDSGFDGDYNYVYGLRSNRTLYRFAIWPGGIFQSPGSGSLAYWITLAATYTAVSNGVAVLGNYVYIWAIRGATYYLLRIAKQDGSITEMTISGTPPDNDAANQVTTDGTDLYILDGATTTLRKYTVSGTTATYSTAITLSEAAAVGSVIVDTTRNTIDFRANGDDVMVKNTIAGALIKREQSLNQTGANTFLGHIGDLVYIKWRDTGTGEYLQPYYY